MNRQSPGRRAASPPSLGAAAGSPRRAAISVETAIVLPALFLTVLGCMDFARMVMTCETLEVAALEAARIGILTNGTTDRMEDAAESELAVTGLTGATITVNRNYVNQTIESSATVSVSLRRVATMFGLLTNITLSRSCTLVTPQI